MVDTKNLQNIQISLTEKLYCIRIFITLDRVYEDKYYFTLTCIVNSILRLSVMSFIGM